LSRVLLFWEKPDFSIGSLNIYATNLVNGIAPVPQLEGYMGGAFNYQLIATNGDFGVQFYSFPYPNDFEEKGFSYASAYAFVDARRHLKENLTFLLRSATINRPFSYASDRVTWSSTPALVPGPAFIWQPESFYARPPSPTSYEYYGFHLFSSNLNFSVMQELRPVQENYLWRNFVFDLQDYDLTGADYYSDPDSGTFLRTLSDPLHKYSGSGTETNPPLAFASTNSTWLFYRYLAPTASDFSAEAAQVGLSYVVGTGIVLGNGVHNCYGLTLNSIMTDYEELVLPSSTVTEPYATYFPNFTAPAFQIADYYWASQTPHFRFGSPRPPLPGSPDFSVTNTSPLLFASVGQPITIAGWAKMAITNGYPGKFAYLEQYFERACTIGTNGTATANQTGLLSPYGEFFPTEPGPTALVTMPDIDTGQPGGTGVVNVIKLQLDVDHNGIMDLSFGGPDNTAQARPMWMWVNNDYDADGLYGAPDHDVDAPRFPDYNYTDVIYGNGKTCIHSKRDLEDYARLWICGMPALTNAGYQVSMSWGSISSGNPVIKLFQSVETNGGTLYLTNTKLPRHNSRCKRMWSIPTEPITLPGRASASARFHPVRRSLSRLTISRTARRSIFSLKALASAQVNLR